MYTWKAKDIHIFLLLLFLKGGIYFYFYQQDVSYFGKGRSEEVRKSFLFLSLLDRK